MTKQFVHRKMIIQIIINQTIILIQQSFQQIQQIMANRQTYKDVIQPSYNPQNQHNFQNSSNTFVLDNRTGSQKNAAELRQQNERLKMMINQLEHNRPQFQEEICDEGGIPRQFNKRIQYNAEKIRDLQTKIHQQEDVMKAYQDKFHEFQDNLGKLMRLDKDIHSKLVNPEQSTTLQRNVKQAMIALNSGASYYQVAGMLDKIRV